MHIPNGPGLYIVTLNNDEAISVNAQDPRIADKAIRVTRANIKVGKAQSLHARKQNYDKTFSQHNVNFVPIVETADIAVAEKVILEKLDDYRIRGRSGRKNEWLQGIAPERALAYVLAALNESGIEFIRINEGVELDS